MILTFVLNRVRTVTARLLMRLNGVALGRRFYVHGKIPYIENDGRMTLGFRVVMRADTVAVSLRTGKNGHIVLADRVFMNNGVEIFSDLSVEIGEHTRIAPYSVISDTNFHAVDEGAEVAPKPIRIGRSVWIGRNVLVLPGTVIGDNAVIAAHSVVGGNVPANQLWRGAPAAFVRDVTASPGFVRR